MAQQTRLAIISHDAGGAEILSSYVRRHEVKPIYVLSGPALKIFQRKIGPIETLPLHEGVRQATSILCGTSWQSDLEFTACKLARALGKPAAAFLDHWVNYQERFVRLGETCIPDEIWVGDPVAEVIATKIFPGRSIVMKENPYFLDIRDELALIDFPPLDIYKGVSILYVCEPVREHAQLRYGDERYWGYVEEEALRYFLLNISVFGRAVRRIQIRPHPSEDIGKYLWAQHEFSLPIVAGGSESLLTEIMGADVVVGCQSMAMVIGLLAGKRVMSCIPPGGRSCVLPHPEILRLQELLAMNGYAASELHLHDKVKNGRGQADG